MGDKVDADEKSRIETAIADLREVMGKDDKAAIESKTQALTEVSQKLAEKMYADAGAEGEPAADANKASADDVVDAEFEEVKENKS